jgi:two-component sensor histidine kinase
MNNFFTIILILIATHTNGQFIDFLKVNSYRAVFAETDAFDSSYLTVLANAYERVLFRVADNGIGKQINATPKGTGFGTALVNLPVQQLEGRPTADTSNGTATSIHFKNTITH